MIQIDLPMPESCYDCPMNYDFSWCLALSHEEWKKYEDYWNLQVGKAEHRPEYCPLKEQDAVVRCRDCKYYDSFSQECRDGIDGIMTPDFYCANGERKEGR